MASDASDSSEEFYDAEDSTPNSSKTSKWVDISPLKKKLLTKGGGCTFPDSNMINAHTTHTIPIR